MANKKLTAEALLAELKPHLNTGHSSQELRTGTSSERIIYAMRLFHDELSTRSSDIDILTFTIPKAREMGDEKKAAERAQRLKVLLDSYPQQLPAFESILKQLDGFVPNKKSQAEFADELRKTKQNLIDLKERIKNATSLL